MAMSDPQVTIVVVPRERFSHSERSLANIYEHTTYPFKLTYVSAGAPGLIRRHLERESQQRGLTPWSRQVGSKPWFDARKRPMPGSSALSIS